ncbi:hypothetical protein [Psychrobacter sanguinis]|uniref:hypothetical protein n=1 Tax=Psychrobacter sanguinis TaxID=861445 RepID=UPI001918A8A3|nr:hypothetical protein [Psychrobacter sanguinis]
MREFTQLELKIIYLAVYELAITDNKNKMDSDYLSVQKLTDDELDELTITIRNKLKRIIKDTADDFIT